MKINVVGKLAYVYTPFHQDFVSRIKQVGGARWDSGKKAWCVPADSVPAVRQMMVAVYGESDIKDAGKRYDAKLTFHEKEASTCSDVVAFGKVLSHASGRDSGARPGPGVCYITGEPTSGGSARYWTSVVSKGSVIMVYDIPEKLIDEEERMQYIDYEIIERKNVAKSELEAEKQLLMERIASIDAMLAADEQV